ncbi:MAG: carboxypeptidase regulatory-like domain-containing protein [Planctomycetes bacterium]|nr:carboxypeptidase regulatory-like domain-containing protein [Planctomycetota bacterium]
MSRWLIVLALGTGFLVLALWGLRGEATRPAAERGTEFSLAAHEAHVADSLPAPRELPVEPAQIVERNAVPAPPPAPSQRRKPEREPAADDLRIQVVDELTGRPLPAGEVSLTWKPGGRESGMHVFIASKRLEEAHDEIRVPRSAMRRYSSAELASGTLQMQLQWLGLTNVEQQLALEPWPTEPLRLSVPASGSVYLRAAFLEPRELRLRIRGPSRASSCDVQVTGGRSQAIPCMLGAELEIYGELPDGSLAALRSAAGPTQPGEERELLVVRSEKGRVVAVRVLGDSSRALPDRELKVHRSFEPSGASRRFLLRSDGEGWIRCGLGDEVRGGALELVLEEPGTSPRRGRIAFPPALDPGEHALGDVELRADTLLASGRVLDRTGRGISMASITVQPTPPEGRAPVTRPLRTDREGRFEIRAETSTSTIALRAEAIGYAPGVLRDIAPGSSELTLILEDGGRCEGSVILPAGFDAKSLEIHAALTPASPLSPGHIKRTLHLGPRGKFAIGDLPAGRLDLEFRSERTGVLERIEGLAIASGETNRDPRIQGLSLALGWSPLRLRLVDPSHASKPLSNVALLLQAEDQASSASTSARAFTDEEGRIERWFPPATSVVRVLAESQLEMLVKPSAEEQELLLQRGWRVTLPIDLSADPPVEGVSLWLETNSGAKSSRAWLANGELEFSVPRADRYRVRIALSTGGDLNLLQRFSEPLPDTTIDITHDGQRLPTFIIPAPKKR